MAYTAIKRPRWRFGLIGLGVVGLLCSALWVHAQTTRNSSTNADTSAQTVVRTVTAASSVAVRSGGNETKSFVTGYVNPGQKVEVIRESKEYPGWLEIKPPAGSFSWINSLLVKRYGKYIATVVADDPIPTRMGTRVFQPQNQIPKKQNKNLLPRGTLVILLDDKTVTNDDGIWLPIAPTPGEVRYIPVSAVRNSPTEPATMVASGPDSSRFLIAQADQAFAGGRYCQATHMYLAAAHRTTDYREKTYCYNKLDMLEKVGGGPSVCLNQPGHPNHNSTTTQGNAFRVASQSTVRYQKPKSRIGDRLREALTPSKSPRWSGWGFLKRTKLRHTNGQPMYVLASRNGQRLQYAVTSDELTLEPYVDRWVCLYGPAHYRSDEVFRNYFVMVSHISVR